MEPGPLPPHERAWRHPSEVAAEERAALVAESPSSVIRATAIGTGVMTLAAVAVLMLMVTPDATSSPIAVSATSLPVEREASSSPPTVAAVLRNPGVAGGATAAMATPIGDGRLALVTPAALSTLAGDELEVRVPSGRLVSGRVVDTAGEALVLELAEHEPGPTVAATAPDATDIVRVMTDPPIDVPLSAVANLQVGEGTAVLDTHGELVGLCSRAGGRARVIEVSGSRDDATSDGR